MAANIFYDYLADTANPGGTMSRQGVSTALSRLHPAFAQKLEAAIKQARAEGIDAGIYSAYRPPGMGVGGFGDKFRSLHAYGIAVDVSGIGRPGSNTAKRWYEIATANGIYNPYGPRNRSEWNHYQLIPEKSIPADHPLRKTITAEGPVDLRKMWDASGVPAGPVAGRDGYVERFDPPPPEPPPTLRKGMGSRGAPDPNVVNWQKYLIDRGFDPGPVDGSFGRKTLTATVAFQRANGLTPDGIVGPKTAAQAIVAANPANSIAAGVREAATAASMPFNPKGRLPPADIPPPAEPVRLGGTATVGHLPGANATGPFSLSPQPPELESPGPPRIPVERGAMLPPPAAMTAPLPRMRPPAPLSLSGGMGHMPGASATGTVPLLPQVPLPRLRPQPAPLSLSASVGHLPGASASGVLDLVPQEDGSYAVPRQAVPSSPRDASMVAEAIKLSPMGFPSIPADPRNDALFSERPSRFEDLDHMRVNRQGQYEIPYWLETQNALLPPIEELEDTGPVDPGFPPAWGEQPGGRESVWRSPQYSPRAIPGITKPMIDYTTSGSDVALGIEPRELGRLPP